MNRLISAIRTHVPHRVLGFMRGVKALGRRISCDLVDLRERAAGQARPLTPPRRMWELVGGGDADFHALGESQVRLLIGLGLQPHHRLLDVGSGIGRLAAPLTRHLRDAGGYDGIEIIPQAVQWCQRVVSPAFPSFLFHRADVRNDRYNPGGATLARNYVFPFEDGVFDFVFLGSVFTHMYAADMRNYLVQIVRVMKPGATCVISYYLLDAVRRKRLAGGGSALRFETEIDGCWCAFPDVPEAAIAFEQTHIEQLYAEIGLRIVSVRLGAWDRSGRQDQDIVIATKG